MELCTGRIFSPITALTAAQKMDGGTTDEL